MNWEGTIKKYQIMTIGGVPPNFHKPWWDVSSGVDIKGISWNSRPMASPAPLAASEAHGNPCRSLAAARYNLSHRRFGRFWGVFQLDHPDRNTQKVTCKPWKWEWSEINRFEIKRELELYESRCWIIRGIVSKYLTNLGTYLSSFKTASPWINQLLWVSNLNLNLIWWPSGKHTKNYGKWP